MSTDVLSSKKIDHFGLISSTLSDLSIPDLVNEQLGDSEQCKISDGTVVSAMIMNALEFTSKPLSLTPQFFENQALDVLFPEKMSANDLNRHRLGRCLDRIHEYGCEAFFSMIAQSILTQENIDQTFVSLDTTSFSVTGEYEADTDENTITICQGYSKDHRPDLKQAVLELLVSQDGGVPIISKSFDGNASDNTIFKSRCHSLIEQFKSARSPRYLVADSKLYSASNATTLKSLSFITRIPRTLKEEQKAIQTVQSQANWEMFDKEHQYGVYECTHYEMSQRWIVVYSPKIGLKPPPSRRESLQALRIYK